MPAHERTSNEVRFFTQMDNSNKNNRKGTSQDYMIVIYGYESIYGFEGGGFERVINEVSKYNLYSLLETTSKIVLKLYSKGFSDQATQIQLIKDIFAEDKVLRKKILDAILKGGQKEWVIFAEQPLLNLTKLILQHAKKKGGNLVHPKDVGQVGKWDSVPVSCC